MCDIGAYSHRARNKKRRTTTNRKRIIGLAYNQKGRIIVISLWYPCCFWTTIALLVLIDTMPKKSRRRTSREIGLGSAAIAQYDREQDCQQAYQELCAQAASRADNNFSTLPSFDDLQRNFKISQNPDAWGNKILRLDESDGRWKLVIPVENLYPTIVGNMVQLQQERDSLTFVELKQYMKRKYAVDDDLLDLFVVKPDNKKKTKAKDTTNAKDGK